MFSDLRLAARGLLRAPGFTLPVVLSLAVGIGAATAIFSVLDAVVLRPLPFHEAGRLVMVWEANQGKGLAREPISPVNFCDYRGLAQVFADATAWWEPVLALSEPGLEPARVATVEAAANFFAVLGVHPALGAGFPAGSPLHRPAAPSVVISDRLWRGRYRGDPAIVGKTIRLDDALHTVLGVMPPGFNFPGETDAWQLLRWDLARHSRAAHFMSSVARLAPGVDLERAQAELNALTTRLAAENPRTNDGWSARAAWLQHEVAGIFRPALFVMFAAVGLLLVVACTNLANLLLARATGREREMAVRSALGASRIQIGRQYLAESAVLAATGSALGIAAAWAGVRGLVAFAPIDIPRLAGVAIDGTVLGFAVLLGVVVALASGLVPALVVSSGPHLQALREGGRQTTARRGTGLRNALVAAEVALAVTLLAGAGLLVRSLSNLAAERTGFEAGPAVTVQLGLPDTAPYPWRQVAPFYATLLDNLSARKGVTEAGAANFLPFSAGWRLPFRVIGEPAPPSGEEPKVQFHTVTDGYLRTLSIPLRRGRWFDGREQPEGPGVLVINEAMARRYWPGGDPIGRKLHVNSRQIGPMGQAQLRQLDYEIVGVVGDVRNTSLREPAEPAAYCSFRQFPFRNMFLVVRGALPPAEIAGAIRSELKRLEPSMPVSDVRTLDALVASHGESVRVLTALMGGFAAFALLVAGLGLFGVLSWAVGRRRQELSIRMALGAARGQVTWMVVRQALTLAAIGAVIGAAGAGALGRGMSRFLFGVTPFDAVTLAASLSVAFAVALVASLVPARRASRANLVEGLKNE